MNGFSVFDSALFFFCPKGRQSCHFRAIDAEVEGDELDFCYEYDGLLTEDLLEKLDSKDEPAAERLVNRKKVHKKTYFIERKGDWICAKCRNMNYSFREVCNKCGLAKVTSFKMIEAYLEKIRGISA